jgi:hypothetical protein
MNLYTGQFWIPFPRSEYGGLWVVIAKDREECVNLLMGNFPLEEEDEDDIDLLTCAVAEAHCFKIEKEHHESRVVEAFLT